MAKKRRNPKRRSASALALRNHAQRIIPDKRDRVLNRLADIERRLSTLERDTNPHRFSPAGGWD